MCPWRWHQEVRGCLCDAVPYRPAKRARDNGFLLDGSITDIEAQTSFPLGAIGAVAGEARIRKDWADVTVVPWGSGFHRSGFRRGDGDRSDGCYEWDATGE